MLEKIKSSSLILPDNGATVTVSWQGPWSEQHWSSFLISQLVSVCTEWAGPAVKPNILLIHTLSSCFTPRIFPNFAQAARNWFFCWQTKKVDVLKSKGHFTQIKYIFSHTSYSVHPRWYLKYLSLKQAIWKDCYVG